VLGASAPAQAADLTVRVILGGGPRYRVGQVIDLEVVATAGATRPVVTPPKPDGATLAPIDVALRPIASSGIGSVESQTNEYRFRFRLIPHKAGTLALGPFRVAAGGKAGSSAPRRLEVRSVPAAGRPTTWLGGVGPLTATAAAQPASVRVGQTLDLVLTLQGPGALGSTGPLDASRIAALSIAPEITLQPDDLTIEPPARTRRLRIRPTQPGRVTLPPVVVSWFDPRLGRYQSAATEGVAIRVEDVAPFDPARLQYGTPGAGPSQRLEWPGVVFAAAVTIGLFAWIIHRARRPRRVDRDPHRQALGNARLVEEAERNGADAPAMAECISGCLADYLDIVADLPRGELTPDEARVGFERVTGDATLGDLAAALTERCDRVRFSGHPGEEAASLARSARELLEAIAARPPAP
jgi:hypothetical protein